MTVTRDLIYKHKTIHIIFTNFNMFQSHYNKKQHCLLYIHNSKMIIWFFSYDNVPDNCIIILLLELGILLHYFLSRRKHYLSYLTLTTHSHTTSTLSQLTINT